MGYDTVLATVNVLDVIHDINIAIIFSDLIPEKTCGDFADVMNKVLTKHGLLEKYQEYMKKFSGLPPTL